ncbi:MULTISPECIES: hypothetical protein [unclassified Pseudomonas]|uniref:hypothetical protein n=1 Tax=unclassified Pseudomonas TaxID=196821 RepID=UPI0015B3CF47|nr:MULTISPECIES: hypothetical protein [unclassified Pseudomonas]
MIGLFDVAGPTNQISVATLAQNLHQQATLVASMEYFWAIIVAASLALVVSMMQKTFR